jgi:hypothetical protein
VLVHPAEVANCTALAYLRAAAGRKPCCRSGAAGAPGAVSLQLGPELGIILDTALQSNASVRDLSKFA